MSRSFEEQVEYLHGLLKLTGDYEEWKSELKKHYLTQCNDLQELMYNLGSYYRHQEDDFDKLKLCWTLAAENGHVEAMRELGTFYNEYESNHNLMKKYYLMAIERGDSIAMFNLALYYEDYEHDLKRAHEYYTMASLIEPIPYGIDGRIERGINNTKYYGNDG